MFMKQRTLQLIARAITRAYGVTVRNHPQAHTDGKTIYLPMVDLKDHDDERAVHGYLDHESGHVIFTEDEPWIDAILEHIKGSKSKDKLAPVFKSTFNLLEDMRIEKAMMDRYPGSRSNLESSASHAGNQPLDLERMSPIAVILRQLFADLRQQLLKQPVNSNQELESAANIYLDGRYGEVLTVALGVDVLQSTAEVADLADQVLAKIASIIEDNTRKYGQPDADQTEQSQTNQPAPLVDSPQSSGGEAGEDSDEDSGEDSGDGEQGSQQSGQSGDDDSEQAEGQSESGGDSAKDKPQDGEDDDSSGDSGSGKDGGADSERDSTEDGSQAGQDADESDTEAGDTDDEPQAGDSQDGDESEPGEGNSGEHGSADDEDETEASDKGEQGESESGEDQSGEGKTEGQSEAGSDAGGETSGDGDDQGDSSEGGSSGDGAGENGSALTDEDIEGIGELSDEEEKLINVAKSIIDHIEQEMQQEPFSGLYEQVARGNPAGLSGLSTFVSSTASRMQALLEDRVEQRRKPRTSGALNRRALHRARVGDPFLFTRDFGEDYDTRANVVLLLDRSGSMEGPPAECLAQSSYVITSALESFGVHTAIMAFGDSYGTTLVKDWDDRADQQRLVPIATGGTPLAPALQWADAFLENPPDPQAKRIVITLTDGYPNQVPYCLALTEQMTNKGIQCSFVGIMCELEAFTQFPVCVVHSVADLPTAFAQLAIDNLLQAA